MAGTALRTPTLETFVIEGGAPLHGRVTAAGNKNAALPILAACALTGEKVELTNGPRIRAVEPMVELLADLGAEAEWTGPNEVRVVAADLTKTAPDEDLSNRIRPSFLLAAPPLAPLGRPAARALRDGGHAAPRWRRHRAAPARHAHPRVQRPRRDDRVEPRLPHAH